MAIIYDRKNNKYYAAAAEARRLGITQVHLSQVLTGKRQSKRIMKAVRIREVENTERMAK